MRNIFQPNRNACFYFPLIAFKWIPQSEEKRIKFVFFLSLLGHMIQIIQFHSHTQHPYWAYVWFYDNFCHSPCEHYCIRVYGLSKANSAVIPDHILWFISFLTLLLCRADGCLSLRTSFISRFLSDILNPGQKWNKERGRETEGGWVRIKNTEAQRWSENRR